MFNGINIFIDNMLPTYKIVRVKEHIKKDWMPYNYHKRIDKKWAKRYGTKKELYFLMTNDGIFCHKENLRKIKDFS